MLNKDMLNKDFLNAVKVKIINLEKL